MHGTVGARVSMAVAHSWAAAVAAMPNGWNFTESAAARTDYTRAEVIGAALDCRGLVALGTADNVVVSAAARRTAAGADYCLVHGVIPLEVQYVLYLPARWNGRLFMHGNWGDAGEPLLAPAAHARREQAVDKGFAVAFTDTGHDARNEPGAVWAYRNLAKEVDYGFRAVHVTVTAAKAMITAYYGRPPHHAYFDGCSTGGRQGLIAAQRFPGDFDGILAGAPVLDLSHMLWQYWRNQMAVDRHPIDDATLERLAAFVLARYDALDGLEDRVIGDPLAVDFDPRRDLPRSGEEAFTEAEIETLASIYAPVVVDGREIYPRTVVGGEPRGLTYREGTWDAVAPLSAWHTRVVRAPDGNLHHRDIIESWFRYLTFEIDDPSRAWRAMDPVRDLPRMERFSRLTDAVDPDLTAFRARGGKLVLYHGWADFGVNPLRSIQYLESVRDALGGDVDDFFRLYLVPGMQHCWGGTNVDRFDLMTPLIDWVEQGIPPATPIGKRIEDGRVTRTRPLCAYPAVARYDGRGDPDEAASFTCEPARRLR